MMVSRQLLVALVNCDDSGLNDDDKMQLYQLAEDVGTATLDIDWNNVQFCRCDYSDLFSDFLEVNLIEEV